MKNRIIFASIFISILLLGFYGCSNKKQELPNVVIIFIDDMGYADIGCFGADDYLTPNIDKMAREGARFTNFYASQAVCSASRASLLTGCYAERIGIQGALNSHSNNGINPNELLIPEMLKEKGYATGIFGKWHLGHHKEFLPLQHGFDEYVGLPYSNDMWPVGFDGNPIIDSGSWKSNYPPLTLFNGNEVVDTIATLEDQAQLTTIYTEEAVQFIEEHRNTPFFLYMPHSMVHVPIAVSDKFNGKSGKGLFADVMMELDWSVGEIIKTLEINGLTDNTLIIFTSDNGPWLNFGNHAGSAYPLREGKGTMWEGGPRVSTIMKWPDVISSGMECDNICSTIDILPTLSEITGASLPTHKIDGVSLLPILEGNYSKPPRDRFYYYYGGELIAVRMDNYKLVFPHTYRSYKNVEPKNDGFPGPYGKGVVTEFELYDLANDISESQNIADQYPEIVEELKIIGDSARNELGDRIYNIKGRNVRKPGRISLQKEKVNNLARNKPISIITEYSYQYAGNGDVTIVNGVRGSMDYTDLEWLGFEGNDFEAVIDMEQDAMINEIECGFLINQKSWIFSPEQVDFLISNDGVNYTMINSIKENASRRNNYQQVKRFKTEVGKKARFLKVHAKSIVNCPDWHPGAGARCWLFVDEIVVN